MCKFWLRCSIATLFTLTLGSAQRASNPDVDLVDQNGRHIHFYKDLVDGHTSAISFVFTSCTTVCPMISENFAKLQKLLGNRLGSDILLISISVDPLNDTPAKLRDFASKHGARPGWTLLTGDKREVDRLLRDLGEYQPDPLQHSTRALVRYADGRLVRADAMGPPEKIAALLLQGH